MTTTADKIEKLQKDLIQAHHLINALEQELKNIRKDIKPADPEPLEGWVNYYGQTKVLQNICSSPEEAKEQVYRNAIRTAVHMREVTPQMEQNEWDAARYRRLKKIFRVTERDWIFNPNLWDKELDAIKD